MAKGETGYYSKTPARGDFVQYGLPFATIAAWDTWASAAMAASQASLERCWRDAWMVAPVWRFRMPKGTCGPHSLLGLWLPSIDRAGRAFPLMIACTSGDADCGGWLDAAVQAGRDAITHDLTPEALTTRLPPAATALGEGGWWTDGAPQVRLTRIACATLPDPGRFCTMLRDADG